MNAILAFLRKIIMAFNPFVRLRRLIPPSPVLIAKVIEHHSDDTSTLELPTGQGSTAYGGPVAVGSRIRARGTTVPVGKNAFVRDGVIENQAPDGTPVEIEIGTVTSAPAALAFNGPIPAQSATVGSAFTLALNGYWTGGSAPRVWSIASGTLPAGLSLNVSTGVISGTPSAASAATSVVIRCTDFLLTSAEGTVAFNSIAAPASLAFNGPIPAQSATVGSAFTLALNGYWTGGSLPRVWSIVSGTLPAGLSLNAGTGVVGGTPTATSASNAVLTIRCTDGASATADGTLTFLPIAAAVTVVPGQWDLGHSVDLSQPWVLSESGRLASYPHALAGGGSILGIRSAAPVSGKIYCEFELTQQSNSNNYHAFGITPDSETSAAPYSSGTISIYSRSPAAVGGCGLFHSAVNNRGTETENSAYAFGVGDRIGVAIDTDAGKVWFRKNGVWPSGDPAAGTEAHGTFTPGGTWRFAFSNYTCNAAGVTLAARMYPTAASQTGALPAGFSAYEAASSSSPSSSLSYLLSFKTDPHDAHLGTSPYGWSGSWFDTGRVYSTNYTKAQAATHKNIVPWNTVWAAGSQVWPTDVGVEVGEHQLWGRRESDGQWVLIYTWPTLPTYQHNRDDYGFNGGSQVAENYGTDPVAANTSRMTNAGTRVVRRSNNALFPSVGTHIHGFFEGTNATPAASGRVPLDRALYSNLAFRGKYRAVGWPSANGLAPITNPASNNGVKIVALLAADIYNGNGDYQATYGGDIGICKAVFVTNEWQTLWWFSNTVAATEANPPPLE